MSNILTMAMKDLLLLWRDKASVFWILLFPLVFALFFGTLFGGIGDDGTSDGMNIAVVDLDGSDGSRAFAGLLDSKAAIDVVGRKGEEAWTVDAARWAVVNGKVVAYIVLPGGFGDAGGMNMFMGEAPEIELGVDPSRTAEKSILEGMLMEASFRRLQDSFSDFSVMREDIGKMRENVLADSEMSPLWRGTLTTFFDSMDTFTTMADAANDAEDEASGESIDEESGGGANLAPIKIRHADVLNDRSGPINSFEISFPQSIVWGIIGCTAGLAMMLVQEKTRGTWIRLRLAPQSKRHILASKGVACFFACLLTISFLLLIGHLLLGVRVHSWVSFVLAVSSSSVCFTGLMMVFATLGDTEQSVAGWAWGGMMPMAMLGGGMVPLMMMPSWMQKMSNISPVKWAVYSMEGAIWRGFSVGQMLVPCAVLVGIGAVGYMVGAVLLSRKEG